MKRLTVSLASLMLNWLVFVRGSGKKQVVCGLGVGLVVSG